MEEQRKERTIDELAAENESLKAEVERLQKQVALMISKRNFSVKQQPLLC